MSVDGAVFAALVVSAVAVIGGGWWVATGRAGLSFEPARTLAPGDALVPATDEPARDKSAKHRP